MITLLYHAESVGPVVRRLAAPAEGDIQVMRDTNIPRAARIEGTVVRWGSRWNGQAEKVVNSAEAVSTARDKRLSRAKLGDLAPATWVRRADVKLPCVIRPRRHHAASKFFTCRTPDAARSAIARCGIGWYASELVEKAREFRVFVFQGHIVAVSERFPADASQVAWNLAMGGRLVNCKFAAWPIHVLRASIEACAKLDLDFGAVDVAIDANNGNAVVFEVNTAPGLRNPYTIERIATCFLYADEVDEPLSIPEGDRWKDYIHPALRG